VINLYTIGFTKSPARNFFNRLSGAGVTSIIDTRLNRVSQLSGFAKQEDLKFFLSELVNINYNVEEDLAPTSDILNAYRKKEISWPEYARKYVDLLAYRDVASKLDVSALHGTCFLCSEATPEHCHRRLAANFLAEARSDIKITHL